MAAGKAFLDLANLGPPHGKADPSRVGGRVGASMPPEGTSHPCLGFWYLYLKLTRIDMLSI